MRAAAASYSYWSSVGVPWNPYSGDQVFLDGMHTHLTSAHMSSIGGWAGLTIPIN